MPEVAEMVVPLTRRLITAARRHELVTYGALAAELGTCARVVPAALKVVQRRCLDRGLPDLSALAVAKATGLPGSGFFEPCGVAPSRPYWARKRESAHRHRWPDSIPD